jgi:hypothetical protein
MCDSPQDLFMAELSTIAERAGIVLATWRNETIARSRVFVL